MENKDRKRGSSEVWKPFTSELPDFRTFALFIVSVVIFEGTWLNLQKTSKYSFEVFQDFIPLDEAAIRRGLAGMLGQV